MILLSAPIKGSLVALFGSVFGPALAAQESADIAAPMNGAQVALEDHSVGRAKSLILAGRSAEARAMLQNLATRDPASNEIDFLLGLLAVEGKDYDEAIRRFRAILVREPKAIRVRLELARAFYLDKDYANAFRNFQFARAGNLEAGVAASIDRYLAAIRLEKNWSYNVSVAIAPDTNINNATSEREAIVFGLPFELGDDARRRSGIGLAVEGGAEFAPRIAGRARMRLGGAIQRREYDGGEFDDTTFALNAGPRFVLKRWDLSFVGTGFRRWFGGRRLNEGWGARLDANYYRDARTTLTFGLAAQDIRYPNQPLHSGAAYSVWGGGVRALTASSSLTARVGVSRKEARVSDLANWSGSVAVGYYRDFRGGFSVYAEPSYVRSRYDEPDAFFDTRRSDSSFELQLALLNRRIVLSRFTPRVSYTFARRWSTIELFDFTQHRFEVGLTSTF